MQWTTGVPEFGWDEALFENGGHYLQSSHWAAFQAAMGRPVFYLKDQNWQCLAILEKTRTGSRLYCPYGPLARSREALKNALAALASLARQHGAVFVRCEPLTLVGEQNLPGFGLQPAMKDIQQHLTWIQDLHKPFEQLMSEMTSTNRNLFNTFGNKGIEITQSHEPADMKLFIELMRQVAARNGIRQHADHYYQVMADTLIPRRAAALYLAKYEGKVIASAFCFDSPVTRYYAHAAADFEARKLHPGTPLVVKAMLEAKAKGQTAFDFMGVAPPNAPSDHKWAGFTQFKQSFGGNYKAYDGTWELPVNGWRYSLYRGLYQLRKLLP